MPHGTSFSCSDCDERIEDSNHPLVGYIVVGLANLHPITQAGEYAPEEVAAFPMPEIMRRAFTQNVQRIDFCVGCMARALNLPLTDGDGKTVASPEKAAEFMQGWRPPESAQAREARIRAAAEAEAAKPTPSEVIA